LFRIVVRIENDNRMEITSNVQQAIMITLFAPQFQRRRRFATHSIHAFHFVAKGTLA